MSDLTRPKGNSPEIKPAPIAGPSRRPNLQPVTGSMPTPVQSALDRAEQIESALVHGQSVMSQLREELLRTRNENALHYQDYEKRIQQFQANEKALQAKLTEQIQKQNRAQSEIQAQAQTIQSLKNQGLHLTQKWNDLRSLAQSKLKAAEHKILNLEAQLKARENEMGELKSLLKSTQDKLALSQNEIALYQSSWTRVLEIEKNSQEVQKHLDAEKIRNKDLEESLKRTEESLRREIEDLKIEKNRSEAELQSQLTKTQTHYIAAQKRANQNETDLTQTRQENAKITAELQAKVTSLTAELERHTELLESAQKEITLARSEAQNRKDQAQSSSLHFEKQIAELQEKIRTLEAQAQQRETDALAKSPIHSVLEKPARSSTNTDSNREMQEISELSQSKRTVKALQEERNLLRNQLRRAVEEAEQARKWAIQSSATKTAVRPAESPSSSPAELSPLPEAMDQAPASSDAQTPKSVTPPPFNGSKRIQELSKNDELRRRLKTELSSS